MKCTAMGMITMIEEGKEFEECGIFIKATPEEIRKNNIYFGENVIIADEPPKEEQ